MSPKHLLALVVIACGAAGGAACSLVSGWSDLEGGGGASTSKDGGGSGPGADASSSSSGSSGGSGGSSGSGGQDGSPGGDTGATPQKPCSGLHCASGESCCIEPLVGARCSSSQQCTFTGGVFMVCVDTRDCGSQGGGQCCLHHDSAQYSTGCGGACAAPDQVSCDPSSPTCGAGQACVQTSAGGGGFANVYVCQ